MGTRRIYISPGTVSPGTNARIEIPQEYSNVDRLVIRRKLFASPATSEEDDEEEEEQDDEESDICQSSCATSESEIETENPCDGHGASCPLHNIAAKCTCERKPCCPCGEESRLGARSSEESEDDSDVAVYEAVPLDESSSPSLSTPIPAPQPENQNALISMLGATPAEWFSLPTSTFRPSGNEERIVEGTGQDGWDVSDNQEDGSSPNSCYCGDEATYRTESPDCSQYSNVSVYDTQTPASSPPNTPQSPCSAYSTYDSSAGSMSSPEQLRTCGNMSGVTVPINYSAAPSSRTPPPDLSSPCSPPLPQQEEYYDYNVPAVPQGYSYESYQPALPQIPSSSCKPSCGMPQKQPYGQSSPPAQNAPLAQSSFAAQRAANVSAMPQAYSCESYQPPLPQVPSSSSKPSCCTPKQGSSAAPSCCSTKRGQGSPAVPSCCSTKGAPATPRASTPQRAQGGPEAQSWRSTQRAPAAQSSCIGAPLAESSFTANRNTSRKNRSLQSQSRNRSSSRSKADKTCQPSEEEQPSISASRKADRSSSSRSSSSRKGRKKDKGVPDAVNSTGCNASGSGGCLGDLSWNASAIRKSR